MPPQSAPRHELTAESLKASDKAIVASKAKKGAAKPAWAMTEKMTEDAKEAEID